MFRLTELGDLLLVNGLKLLECGALLSVDSELLRSGQGRGRGCDGRRNCSVGGKEVSVDFNGGVAQLGDKFCRRR